jgi:hypothetical protein
MWKALAAAVALSAISFAAHAQPVTDPAEIAGRLRFWATDPGQPVYYGEVRNVDARSRRVLGHYQCLALAFISYENGVFRYAHKMWSKSADGSCHYDDVTSRKVGNHGLCVRDSEAGFGAAVGTAKMTKANIDWQRSVFRAIDTNARTVGETAACVKPKGVGAGLVAIRIEDGRFKVITNRPLDYEVSIEPQDPTRPPTAPVF